MLVASYVGGLSPGFQPAAWRLDPAYQLTPDARVVHVLIWVEGAHCSYMPVKAETTYLPGIIIIGTRIGRGMCLLASGELPHGIALNQPVGGRLLIDSNGSYVVMVLLAIGLLVPIVVWLVWRSWETTCRGYSGRRGG